MKIKVPKIKENSGTVYFTQGLDTERVCIDAEAENWPPQCISTEKS